MTPEAQRIAIAEATFFQRVDDYGSPAWRDKRNPQSCVLFTNRSGGFHLPEVTLDALHEAEKTLTDEQWGTYVHALARHAFDMQFSSSCLIHATASQKAEAFLRTLGKWEDGK